MFKNCLLVNQQVRLYFFENQFFVDFELHQIKKLHETKSLWIVQDRKIPKFNFVNLGVLKCLTQLLKSKSWKKQKFDYQ